MRTDDALNLSASSLALVLFALRMTDLAELAAIFFRNPLLPVSHGPHLAFGNPVPAAKEVDVCKSSCDYSVQASFAEPMFAPPLLECPRAAIPGRWRPVRTM